MKEGLREISFHWLSSEYWPDIIKNLRRSLTNCRYHLRATLARSSSEASQYSVLPINPPHGKSEHLCYQSVLGLCGHNRHSRVRKTENFAGFTGFYREVHAGSPLAHPRLRFASLS
uniref:Uncharacterized protein n=1 Tax=Klebsiella pneumoniae TaxID=573 RepID=A0A2P1BNL1_KLEPN|nr:hypothetical protein [Klebsiella pneumoniae]